MTTRRQRVRPTLETLEDRVVPTTTVFLDFGEGFAGGSLTTTAGELRTTIAGPNLIGEGTVGGTSAIADATQLRFDSLASVVATQKLNINGIGAAGDAIDFIALRDSILKIVQRQYAPFDVNIVINRATSLADVNNALRANAGDATGQFDAYVFVTGSVRTDLNLRVGKNAGILGIAPGADAAARKNSRDESVIVCADSFLGTEADKVQVPFDIAMANVVAHESGHALGLDHTHGDAGGDVLSVLESDLMIAGGEFRDLTNIGFFSRLNLKAEDGGPLRNAHDQLVNDPDIGRRAGSQAFVTGSGAFDKITITQVSSTQAAVVVDIYREASYTNRIGFASYTINTANGILVDGGFRDDTITIDGRIGKLVTVYGGSGKDTLTVSAAGTTSALVTDGQIRAGATVVKFLEIERLNVTGDGRTVLTVDGSTTATGGQFVTLGAGSVSGIVPLTVNYNLIGSLTVNAGKHGNNVYVMDTTPNVVTNLFTGTGKDTVSVLKTSGALTIHGQNGADEIALGGGHETLGPLAVINGNLTIENAGSRSKLTVLDATASDFRNIHLWTENGYGKLTGLGKGQVLYNVARTTSLDYRGGNAGYEFIIDQASVPTTIRTGTASDRFYIYGTTGALTIDAGAGVNEVVVGGFSLTAIKGAVDLRATGGANLYDIGDLAEAVGGQQYYLSATQFYRTNFAGANRTGTITFRDTSDLEIAGGRAGNSYYVTDTPTVQGFVVGGEPSVGLYTGAGADYVHVTRTTGALSIDAGAGNDIVIGNGAVHWMTGGAGRDLLIAGGAPATLIGDLGEDILIGGRTTLDNDRAALNAIRSEWGRTDLSYAERVNHLLFGGGLNGATQLSLAAGTATGGHRLLGSTGDLDLFFGSQTQDVHDWDAGIGEVFVGEPVQITAQGLSGAAVTLDYGEYALGESFAVSLQAGSHWVAVAGSEPVFFTVAADGTIDYAPELEGILSGRGTAALGIHGVAVEIDARNLGGASLYVDYTAYDPAAPQTLTLLPGQHWFNLAGGEVVYFTVNLDGTISYDAAYEGALTGAGTGSLAIHGLTVQVDIRALGLAEFMLDYVNYDAMTVATVRLLPGQHWLVGAGGEAWYFTVNLDGTLDYGAEMEGIFSGRGLTELVVLAQ